MLESVRFNKGLGDTAIFARILSGAQFWDFAVSAWVDAESSACRAYLSELTDSSDSESWYQATFADPPGGPYPVEIYHGASLIGNDLTPAATSASVYSPMGALTGQQILNDAMSVIQSGGAAVRAKMLGWLNVVASFLATERPWVFLSNGSATLTPVANSVPLPSDFGEFQYITAPNAFYLDQRNRLTPGEAQHVANSYSGYPVGFTQDNSNIRLHGAGFTSPVTLGYTIAPGVISDNATPTCWPWQCRALFMKACLDFFYEFDMDERKAANYQMSAVELSRLKKWDNSQRPKTQNSRHGYRRTR